MSDDNTRATLEDAFTEPAAQRDGNVLSDILASRGRLLLQSDRDGVIRVVDEWLRSDDEILATQAAMLAGRLALVELRPVMQSIRDDMAAGKRLSPDLLWQFDISLDDLAATESW